jgi:PAS domain S-box-containing protein
MCEGISNNGGHGDISENGAHSGDAVDGLPEQSSNRPEFEQLLAELLSTFVNLRPEELDDDITRWLGRISDHMQIERSVVWQTAPSGREFKVTHYWTVSGGPVEPMLVPFETIPWLSNKLTHGETVICDRVADLPDEARIERDILLTEGVKSVTGIPLTVAGRVIGAASFGTLCHERPWTEPVVKRLQLLCEVFAGTLHRRQALEAVKIERDRAQQYLDVAGAILVALDHEGRVTMINQRGGALLGYAEDEIIGRDWFESFLPKRLAKEVRETFDPLMTGERLPAEQYENAVLTRHGEERLIAWHNTLLRDAEGRIVGTLSSGEDITERRQIERALRESKERFERVTHQSREMVWEVDIEGLFTYVSPASEVILGYRPDEMVGKMHFYDLQPKCERKGFRESSLVQIAQRKSFRNDVNKAQTKDGRVVWFLTSGAPFFDEAGEIKGYIGSDLDITERVLMEDRLRIEREELAEKNIALKQVLDHLENGKAVYKHEISSSVENLLMPFVRKLKAASGQLRSKDIEALENSINSIVSNDIDQFGNNFAKLTPRERDVVELIRNGKTSKQIAESLSIDVLTVHKHRDAIRRKLQLRHKDINLTSYLRSRTPDA